MGITHTTPSVLTPVRVTKTDADLTSTTTGAWTDLDTGGSAAARPLDVVIPNVITGSWVSAKIDAFSAANAQGFSLDVWNIVAGSPVRRWNGGLASNFSAWGWMVLGDADFGTAISAEHFYQLQADDIENGSVRLRVRYFRGAGSARALSSSSGGQFVFEGRGPFV